jgi:hypothetical protein
MIFWQGIDHSWGWLGINLNLVVQVGDGLYATTNYNGRSRLGFTLHCGNLA